jgi:hypothetical protein
MTTNDVVRRADLLVRELQQAVIDVRQAVQAEQKIINHGGQTGRSKG